MTGWEQDAVAGARAGRAGAYARLVRRYRRPLDRAVRGIVHDPDQARDVTQQAFVSAYENLHRFDPHHRFFSWIYRIALNEALNARRGAARHHTLEGLDPPDPRPGPEERLLARERRAGLRAALAALPVHYRTVLALRYEEELPYAEVGQRLGLPVSTVKSRLHDARQLLRRLV
jgi:RNA polymerase sigma-70 factor (ECF subfamily)